MASKTAKLSRHGSNDSRRNAKSPVRKPVHSNTPAFSDDFSKSDADEQMSLVLRDYEAGYAALSEGRLDSHAGRYVAFCNGVLAGWGAEPEGLRDRVSEKLGVHRERLAVIHVKDRVTL